MVMKKIYTFVFVLFVFSNIHSQVEGTWILAPEAQALAVGPALGDFSWWSNSSEDLSIRACLFDDKFVFNADGSFENIQDGDTWIEQWQSGSAEACGAPVAPHDGSGSATWSYDAGAGTLTLSGVGAHLGLPKVVNGAEIANPADAPASITYPVAFDGDRMTVDINFGPGFWHFVFVKDVSTNTVDLAKEDLFSFFPNPANTSIQIQTENVLDQIIIRDIAGKVVMMKSNPVTNDNIDVSSLSGGLYIIEARSGNKISVEKLSIN